jgi:short-subunit dehydrogenase
MGAVNGIAAVLPRMIARRAGHIAIVSSVAGYRGLPSAAAYGASKAALINLAESLKPDLDKHGVRVSLVNPGFVRTPLTDRNTFPMPFLMEVDDAAAQFVAGLDKGKFEITFPRRFTFLLKLARMLPYALYFRLVKRATRDAGG